MAGILALNRAVLLVPPPADDPARWLRRSCASAPHVCQIRSGAVLGPASPSGRLIGRFSSPARLLGSLLTRAHLINASPGFGGRRGQRNPSAPSRKRRA